MLLMHIVFTCLFYFLIYFCTFNCQVYEMCYTKKYALPCIALHGDGINSESSLYFRINPVFKKVTVCGGVKNCQRPDIYGHIQSIFKFFGVVTSSSSGSWKCGFIPLWTKPWTFGQQQAIMCIQLQLKSLNLNQK